MTPVEELTLTLRRPSELFSPPVADDTLESPWQVSGVDRVCNELKARSFSQPMRLTIRLLGPHAEPALKRKLVDALQTYCSEGIRRAENELAAVRREGWRAMGIGVVLLVVFLAASEAILRSKLQSDLRMFFGDGLFIVVAWVGIWYPLDTLIYAGRPYRSEKRLLEAIGKMEVVVVCD